MTAKRNACMIMRMKRYANPRGTLIFMLIAIPMMIFIDLVVFEGRTPFLFMDTRQGPQHATVQAVVEESGGKIGPVILDTPESAYLPQYGPMLNMPPVQTEQPVKEVEAEKEKAEAPKAQPKKAQEVKPAIAMTAPDWKAPVSPGSPGKVVIIIDDMGMGSSTRKLIPLPGPLTLAYLPYAKNLPEQTKLAHQAGHELMVHMPMQPSNAHENPGPGVLTVDMSEAGIKAALDKALDSFTGYVGINNHMGSKLTSDPQAMGWVMEVLKARGLFFVDSKTIGSSVGAQMAAQAGLPFAARDVFLDHYTDINSVHAALRQLETIARAQGVAIAIGHPKPHTIQALREWLPTLKSKNLTLVPASAVVASPGGREISAPEKESLPDDESYGGEIFENEDAEDVFKIPSFSMSLPDSGTGPLQHQAPARLLE